MAQSFQPARHRKRTAGAILSEREVAVIKRKLLDGMTPRELSHIYLVATETIRRIAREETWGWVTPAAEGMDALPEGEELPPISEELKAKAAASQAAFLAKMQGAGKPIPFGAPTKEDEERDTRVAARFQQEADTLLKPGKDLQEFIDKPATPMKKKD